MSEGADVGSAARSKDEHVVSVFESNTFLEGYWGGRWLAFTTVLKHMAQALEGRIE
jgi:hypothetical protein